MGNGKWIEFASLVVLFLFWAALANLAQSRVFPDPVTVGYRLVDLIRSGPLVRDFSLTLARSLAGFIGAMAIGCLLGILFGRVAWLDRFFSLWVVIGLNIPALVVGILCYIALGLTDLALVTAVILNKVPLVTTTLREGVRALSADYDELARIFRLPRWRVLLRVHLPQLVPYILAAARTGLSLVWKIVLVFEVIGSDGGVGFRVGLFFQNFDMAGLLAYTVTFVGLVLGIEYAILRPLEERSRRWRNP